MTTWFDFRPMPAPEPAKRNAYLAGRDDDTMVRALDRAERRIAAMLDDERNGWGDSGIDAEPFADLAYVVPG